MPLVWLCALVTIGAIVGAAAYLGYTIKAHPDVFASEAELPDDVMNAILVILATFFGPLLIYFFRLYAAAGVESNAVLVTEKQYPELYALYKKSADSMGITRIPRFYVVNGNGALNAFALSCNTKHKIVVIHSELAKVARKNPSAIEFVLAHELGHHKLGHTSLFRNMITIIPNFINIFGASVSRAQEYSADRVAMSLVGDTTALSSLAAGVDFYDTMDIEAYHQQCLDQQKSFLMRVTNWFSDHAILNKRYLALRAFAEKGPSAHGEMF
jgi:Zn-dependent protease with chaperone function